MVDQAQKQLMRWMAKIKATKSSTQFCFYSKFNELLNKFVNFVRGMQIKSTKAHLLRRNVYINKLSVVEMLDRRLELILHVLLFQLKHTSGHNDYFEKSTSLRT